MKKFNSTIVVSLASLFILAACAAPPTEVANEADPVSRESFSRYGAGLDCSMLHGQGAQETCRTQVNEVIGVLLEDDIISRFDMERCNQLNDKIGDNCKIQLENLNVQGPISDEELAQFNRAVIGTFPEPDQDLDGAPNPTFDSTLCAELTTPGYKELCESQIVAQLDQIKLDEILAQGEESRCGELSAFHRTQCEDFFAGGPEVPPPGRVGGVDARSPESASAPNTITEESPN